MLAMVALAAAMALGATVEFGAACARGADDTQRTAVGRRRRRAPPHRHRQRHHRHRLGRRHSVAGRHLLGGDHRDGRDRMGGRPHSRFEVRQPAPRRPRAVRAHPLADHHPRPDGRQPRRHLRQGWRSKCDGRDASNCYAFQAPPANAAALKWAGFDVVNLANNHSYDYLGAGLTATKRALAANRIAYTGLDGTIAVRTVNGVRVAFLGFSPYPWSPDIADLAAAKVAVKQAARTADVVVVLMHAGAEGADKSHTPRGAETAYREFRGNSRAFSTR